MPDQNSKQYQSGFSPDSGPVPKAQKKAQEPIRFERDAYIEILGDTLNSLPPEKWEPFLSQLAEQEIKKLYDAIAPENIAEALLHIPNREGAAWKFLSSKFAQQEMDGRIPPEIQQILETACKQPAPGAQDAATGATLAAKDLDQDVENIEQHFFDSLAKGLIQSGPFLMRPVIEYAHNIELPKDIQLTALETEYHIVGLERITDSTLSTLGGRFLFHNEFESRNRSNYHINMVAYDGAIGTAYLNAGQPGFSVCSAVVSLRRRTPHKNLLAMDPARKEEANDLTRLTAGLSKRSVELVEKMTEKFPIYEDHTFPIVEAAYIELDVMRKKKMWILIIFYALRCVTQKYTLRKDTSYDNILRDVRAVIRDMKRDKQLQKRPDVFFDLLVAFNNVSQYVFRRAGEKKIADSIHNLIIRSEVQNMAPFVSFLEKERLANKQIAREAQQVKREAQQVKREAQQVKREAQQKVQEAERKAEQKVQEAERKAEQNNQDAKQIIAALLQIAQNKSNSDLDIDKVMAQAKAFLI